MRASSACIRGTLDAHVEVVWNPCAVVSTHITLDETTNIALSYSDDHAAPAVHDDSLKQGFFAHRNTQSFARGAVTLSTNCLVSSTPTIALRSNESADAWRITCSRLECLYEYRRIRGYFGEFDHASGGERGFGKSKQTNEELCLSFEKLVLGKPHASAH